MNFVGSSYYRTHRIMLMCLGLWPYYTRCSNYICCILLSLSFLSGIIFQLTPLINKEYSMDIYLNVYSFTGPILLYIIKYYTIFFKSNKTKNLMEQIRYDWDSLKEKEELKIMHKRANIGKRFTFIMIILTYTMIFLCMLTFFWPNILDIMIPLNESRQPWNFPNTIEYFINQKKYIYLLIVYLILIGFIGATILIALDTLAMMCTQHACAMFQITSYRIECIVNKSQMKSLAISKKSDTYKSIAKAIDSHLRGIKFVESMKSIYETVHLFIIPIGVTVLSINLYHLCEYIMADTRDSRIIITFGFIICHFCYMFLNNYIGQQIIDHSNNVFKKICSTRWYATPVYTQKCLLLMMHRSMKSITLSVRCVFLPSLEGFATNSEISLFETNIRFMGSLLACYALTGDVMFRDKAAQLGERMLPAFQTETGIPHSLINLHTGASKNYGWASSGCSILSEIGTMHLEFTYLSDITNNPVFKSKVENVRKVLKSLEKPKGLYPNYIHPRTGKWGQHHMSLGGLGDSFYEYLLKAWIQSNKEDVEAREMYDQAIAAITEHMIKTSPGKLVYVSDLKYDRLEHKMGHLACFAGGMFALGAKTQENELSDKYMNIAAGLTNTCHESYDRSATKLGPEAFHFIENNEARSLKNGEKYYILRPETFESYFVMWRLTKDPKYREWGWEAVQALEKHCRVPGGFTGLNNVYIVDSAKDDVQQSYFFAETLKYLYLLFSDDDLISLDDWVFNSEAHVLPIKGNPLYRPASGL